MFKSVFTAQLMMGLQTKASDLAGKAAALCYACAVWPLPLPAHTHAGHSCCVACRTTRCLASHVWCRFVSALGRAFGQNPYHGAWSTLYAATSPGLTGKGWAYLGPNLLGMVRAILPAMPDAGGCLCMHTCTGLIDELRQG